jgi:hypothetical protein
VTHHRLGVGQLRQELWRDERRHLDFAHPGGVFRVEPGELGLGRHDSGDALQPVAHAHFANRNLVAHRRLPIRNAMNLSIARGGGNLRGGCGASAGRYPSTLRRMRNIVTSTTRPIVTASTPTSVKRNSFVEGSSLGWRMMNLWDASGNATSLTEKARHRFDLHQRERDLKSITPV